ncbi:Protein of unknown function [Cotesia congregata]|uniref:Reverse transcriptase domain-containing protein n=1 Tax=Cotesia congregata TaxID=51543 RepID=A0A8J2MLQ8_COTCN|nr:Protein of unknown function [Cotesia congregata]
MAHTTQQQNIEQELTGSNSIIRFSAINVNSLEANKRKLDMEEFVKNNQIDIALISETKLHSEHKLSFNDYNLIRTDRPNAKNGGGTAILINKKLSFTPISYPNSLSNKVIEYTAIRLKVNSKKSLIIFSIYAACNSNRSLIAELDKIYHDFRLDKPDIYFIMAGDWNARHTKWGDSKINDYGAMLNRWEVKNSITHKCTLYNPNRPTYPSAGSYLDHCLPDTRIEIKELSSNGLLKTLPYDSHHNAIYFTIDTNKTFMGLASSPPPTIRYNYKRTNWRKFAEDLLYNHKNQIPSDKNLTISEIDSHILNLEKEITTTIIKIVPKVEADTKKGCLKYVNNTIKKLQAMKSKLISEKFRATNQEEKYRLNQLIKEINKKLTKEFQKSETAYWTAKTKSINYRDSAKFFPRINRFFRYREPPRVDNLTISKDSPLLTDEIINDPETSKIDGKHLITHSTAKLNIIGKYFESINSPRYSNIGTMTKTIADNAANDIKKHNLTHTTFNRSNRAYYPVQNENEPKFLHSYIEVEILLKKTKNKTSSGTQQGTVTSPILFIIYCRNVLNLFLMNSGNNTHYGAYADDTAIYVAHTKIPVIEKRLTSLVNQIYEYLEQWNLKMNAFKSETILFRKTVNEITPPTVLLIKTFQIKITDKDTGLETIIPNK